MAQAIFEKAVLHVISDIRGGPRAVRHAPSSSHLIANQRWTATAKIDGGSGITFSACAIGHHPRRWRREHRTVCFQDSGNAQYRRAIEASAIDIDTGRMLLRQLMVCRTPSRDPTLPRSLPRLPPQRIRGSVAGPYKTAAVIAASCCWRL